MKIKRLLSFSILVVLLASCGHSIKDSSSVEQSSNSQTTSEVEPTSSGDTSIGDSSDFSSETTSQGSETSESISSEQDETMHLVVGDIFKGTASKINPSNPVTYYAALGGYYEKSSSPTVSGRVKVSLSTNQSELKAVLKWAITVEGGSRDVLNVTEGSVSVLNDASLDNVEADVNNNPTTTDARYVKIILSMPDVSYEQFLAFDEANYTVSVEYE